jgi:hypothetical protein
MKLRSGYLLKNVTTKKGMKNKFDATCRQDKGEIYEHRMKLTNGKRFATLAEKYPQYDSKDCVPNKNKAATIIQRKIREGRFNLPTNWPTNLSNNSVQNYLNNYSRGLKTRKPLPHAPINGVEGQHRCHDGSKQILTATQSMLYSLAYSIARTKTPNKGLLAWHSTGSGKTCSAATIMHAFLNTDKRIIYCTTVEAKKSNPPETFNKCFRTYFPKTKMKDISKRVQFLTFAQLAHKIGLYRPIQAADTRFLDNACLIMDEVQNLLNPKPGQRKEHVELEKFLLKDDKPELKMFIMTATPGSNVSEVVRLLNLVRDRRLEPIISGPKELVLADIKKKSKGILQHFDSNNDFTRFPRVTVQPALKCFMSKEQTNAYKKAIKSSKKEPTVRKYANAMYMPCHRNKATKPCKLPSEMPLEIFSCKFAKLIQNLVSFPDQKHWVYSSFFENRGYGQGITAIKHILQEIGFSELEATNSSPEPGPRFCVVTNPSLNKTKNALSKLLEVFNSKENAQGQLCQIMLASNKFNEGVDLKAVRHIHIVEPQLNMSSVNQAIGRARRFCSHKQLAYKDWTVQVHSYISDPLDGEAMSIDRKILREAEAEDLPLQKVFEVLKRASVDIKMFKRNVFYSAQSIINLSKV